MTLFERPSDIETPELQSTSIVESSPSVFFEGNSLLELEHSVGCIEAGQSLHFVSKGAWSNHNLIEYLARKIGACKMYFMTYSISEETLRNIHLLQSQGLITEIHAMLDYRIEKRKAESFQFAKSLINSFALGKCHAKVTVLINDEMAYSVTGSSNMTKNRKIEAGVITACRPIALAYSDWIQNEINNV